MDTLRMVLQWIGETSPTQYLTKESAAAIGESTQAKIRDWVDKASDLIDKTWNLPDMLVDDAIQVLRESIDARKEGSQENL